MVRSASDGEKARSISAAMIPTGKKRSTNDGRGNDGNINGKTTMDAARAAKINTDPKLKHLTILFLTSFY